MSYKKRFWHIVSEIESVLEGLNNHPDYSGVIRKQSINYLMAEANKSSAKIEVDFKDTSKNKKKIAYNRLSEALDFVSSVVADRKKSGNLLYDHYLLIQAASILEPEKNKGSTYRHNIAQIGSSYKSFENIEYDVDNVLYHLNSGTNHPIFNAIDAHLQLINIHPFKDGNGRLSRLIQNFFLTDNNYTPSIIVPSCGDDYMKLVERAREDREKNLSSRFSQSSKELDFFSFVAESILCTSKCLEDELSKNKFFQVNFSNVDNGELFNYLKRMRSSLRRNNSNVKIKVVDGSSKRKNIRVKGDISRDDLKTILDNMIKKEEVSYKIQKI